MNMQKIKGAALIGAGIVFVAGCIVAFEVTEAAKSMYYYLSWRDIHK